MDRSSYISSLPAFTQILSSSVSPSKQTKIITQALLQEHNNDAVIDDVVVRDLLPENSMGLSIEPATYGDGESSASREIEYLSFDFGSSAAGGANLGGSVETFRKLWSSLSSNGNNSNNNNNNTNNNTASLVSTWNRLSVPLPVTPAFFSLPSSPTSLSDPSIATVTMQLLMSQSNSFAPALLLTTDAAETFLIDHRKLELARIEREAEEVWEGVRAPPSLVLRLGNTCLRIFEIDESVRASSNDARWNYSCDILKKAYSDMLTVLEEARVCDGPALANKIGLMCR